MNGIIKRAAAACLGGGLSLAIGCETYRDLVDPCYPARYSALSRQSVNETFAAQVNNGHVLDQTVWNYHFEKGTNKLTPMGEAHLAYLARRRPNPDAKLFLQTAQDVPFDPANPGEFARMRSKLDADRVQTVLGFVQAQTAGRPVPFDVTVHDPAEVGMSANRMFRTPSQGEGAVLEMERGYKGILAAPGGGGGGAAGGGGASK
jgi:hypothetical protein